MSFDINPLGPQMHLKQIEREVRQQHLFEQTTMSEERKPAGTASFREWLSHIVPAFAAPRHTT